MSIRIDDLAREVMKGLDEYADVTTEQVKRAVRKAGNTVRCYDRAGQKSCS